MRRREFVALLCSSLVPPVSADSQAAPTAKRLGILMPYAERDPEAQSRVRAVRQRLAELGWAEDRGDLIVDVRWSADPAALTSAARALVDHKPDAVIAITNPALRELQRTTRSIPLVFVAVSFPVEDGFVASLARPGGNTTGFTNFEVSMAGKWLDLAKELAPNVSLLHVLSDPRTSSNPKYVEFLRREAPAFGFSLFVHDIEYGSDFARLMREIGEAKEAALIVLPTPVTTAHRELIANLAREQRLPAIYPFPYFAHSGGLISYGVSIVEQCRQAAYYVDQIFRGADPGNLPVQQATKFELVINLNTARALGIQVPLTLQAQADEVIE